MKIGIITHCWGKDNYGQQLQIFALQQQLKKSGHEPFLIRYQPIKQSLIWARLLKALNPIKLGSFLIRKLTQKAVYHAPIICRDMAGFRQAHVIESEFGYRNLEELRNNPPQADAYIVGSDQVWNSVGFAENEYGIWYLNFGDEKTKRISYAASFGRDEATKQELNIISPLLRKFSAVSVREASGLDICKKANCLDAVHTLDPTLLLNKEEYQAIAEPINVKEPFIFGYFLNIDNAEDISWSSIAKFTAQKQTLGTKFLNVPAHGVEGVLPCDDFYYPNVAQWLGAYDQAQAIITSSFHGMVFAIIYQKPFLVFTLKGAAGRMNGRITSLLAALGLSERIYEKDNGSMESQMDKNIDWESVRNKLEVLRKTSTDFLFNALK